MKWFSGRRKQDELEQKRSTVREQTDRDERLAQAQQELARIRVRAARVAGPLERRLRRNYWGETAAAIARREH